jgi:hypothetical protein
LAAFISRPRAYGWTAGVAEGFDADLISGKNRLIERKDK